MHPLLRPWLALFPIAYLLFPAPAPAAPFSTNANRLAYLDEDNPFYPHRDFPKLITPQWVGEPGVEAVVILAIDDMRDSKKYETYLRPILDRLKKMDGRAPVSIFANVVTTNDTEQLQTWLAEGLSLEVHTLTHPCPLLQKGSFTNAWNTYHGGVDLLSKVPGNKPVAFRMPCCDSMNSPSPRFYAEIFNRTSPDGNFLQADSSVMCLLTDDFLRKHGQTPPKPPEHPATSSPSPPAGERAGVRGQTPPSPKGSPTSSVAPPPHPQSLSPDGGEGSLKRAASDHFRRYFPALTNALTKKSLANFGTYIEDYPYPYVINRTCWEFPAMVPSDWEAFNAHGPTNAATVADWQLALDAVVRAQGVFTFIFHPHGWIRSDQIIQFIDHAERTHGKKVKFLTFKEAVERLNRKMLQGHALREVNGVDNGVRVLDANNDGFMDFVWGTGRDGFMGVWRASDTSWSHPLFGTPIVEFNSVGEAVDLQVRFGLVQTNGFASYLSDNSAGLARIPPKRIIGLPTVLSPTPVQYDVHWGHFDGASWRQFDDIRKGLALDDYRVGTALVSAWEHRPLILRPSAKGGFSPDDTRGNEEARPVAMRDFGVRFRDFDRDGRCELLVSNDKQNALFAWSDAERAWKKIPYALPPGLALVNERGEDNGLRFVDLNGDGFDDLLLSNEKEYAIYLWARNVKPHLGWHAGWSHKVLHAQRPALNVERSTLNVQRSEKEIPPFVRSGAHRNNGAWFHRNQLFVQNEDTAHLPDVVWRKSFSELIAFDMPAPKTPAESQQCFQVRPGFRVELVAAEPLVQSPVAFEWGADGKLWVVEMGDYPNGIPEQEARAASPSPFVGRGERAGVRGGGKLKFLEDLDGDGRYDKATVFLDGLPFPTGVMPWRRGVLISAAPDILYAEDTDGDGKADMRKVLFTGFREGNQQHRMNGFELGLDNWIYGANGDSGGSISFVSTVPGAPPQTPDARPKTPISISGRDFRFRPDTGEFEAIEGQTQFGRRRDDWGNWFGNNNPNWLWHYWLPDRYLRRNPHLAVKSSRQMLANYPDSTRCFPISTPPIRFNQPQSVNHVTSGCSPAPYRDDLFGPGFATSVFISEPVHNLVHREVLVPDGVSFTSRRAPDEQDREFLASTDTWFRPTMLKTGPDGALYIADFYRFVLEHPEWIAPETQARLDLRAGADKGRIWRVVPVDQPRRPVPNLAKLNTTQLVAALDSPSGWQRDTAQRLLVERGDKAAVVPLIALFGVPWLLDNYAPLSPEIRKQLPVSPSLKAQVHALYALDALGYFEGPDEPSLHDPIGWAAKNEVLMEHLIQLNGRFVREAMFRDGPWPGGFDFSRQLRLTLTMHALAKLAESPSPRVRFQFAVCLGEWPVRSLETQPPRTGPPWNLDGIGVGVFPHGDGLLLQLARREADPRIQTALLTSLPRHAHAVLDSILRTKPGPTHGERWSLPGPFLEQLLLHVIPTADNRLMGELLENFRPHSTAAPDARQLVALSALLEALDRSALPLEKLVRTRPALKPQVEAVYAALATARTTALSQSAIGNRQSAITLLGRGPSGRAEDLATLATLLKPQQPAEIQTAAVAQLAKLGGSDSASALLADWKAHSPALREAVLSALLSRPAWIDTLLDALERGQVAPTQISPAQRQKLTTHPQTALRDRATKLFAATSADRAKVIKDYAVVSTLTGSETRGRELFTKNCGVCHKLKGEGREIGPDLGQVTTRDTDWLLTAILDPNAAVESRYLGYTAETKSGREFTGIITAETPNNLVMRGADGIEETILRTDLKQLLGSGLSLMPEGMESALKPQDMADLLAFIRAK